VLANRLVNRLGLLMVPHLCADLGCTPGTALTAVLMAESWVAGEAFWAEMDALEATLPMEALLTSYSRVRGIVSTLAAWIVRHGLSAKAAEELGEQVRQAPALLPKLFSPSAKQILAQREKGWQNLGYGVEMARKLSLLSPLVIVPDAVQLRGNLNKSEGLAALQMQLNLGELLHMPALMQKARSMAFSDGWSRQAVMAMLLEFLHCQRHLTQTLLSHKTDVAAWKKKHAEPLGRYNQTVAQVMHERSLTVAMLSVIVGRLRELAP
jgi:NAD-specific glutamate dehydrogenase